MTTGALRIDRPHSPGAAEATAHTDEGIARLTARECEVAAWMVEGKTNPEIGVILGISFRTVDRHVGAILRKLGVENRTTAAVHLASRGSVLGRTTDCRGRARRSDCGSSMEAER
jgi:DNA-binding CsgD family transcriptional regulator